MSELDFRSIGLKIKEQRLERGVTQEHVANLLNVNPSHISNIECGRARPSLTTLIKIANILQCSVDCFIGGEYTFAVDGSTTTLDEKIMERLKYCEPEKKQKILKMIELI